jgi:mannose-1-phosphate guanylyltransferase
LINVILAGGNGTRLFPLSRELMPKQFLKIFDGESLFQKTIKRNLKISDRVFIISNEKHYFLALDELDDVKAKFLLEPIGRNTAPAIALSCFSLKDDDIVLVTSSDHLIKNEKNYQEAIEKAKELAKRGFLVTFGVNPTSPETGYGYIEADGLDVKSFKEKPDIETAKEYLKSKNFYWNSGIFCFKVSTFLNELKKHSKDIYQLSRDAYKNSKKVDSLVRINIEDMSKIPDDSIDYAILEKSDLVKVVPSDLGWSDLGSFDSLASEIYTKADIEIDSKNNLIFSDKKSALIDIEDLIIIDSYDFLLVCRRDSSQKVKDVVKILKKESSSLPTTSSKVYRPWGSYEVLEVSSSYKIKKIVVKPQNRLSLQKHFHRNEHWIVVSGTAKVTIEQNEFLVRANESTYIKMGDIHRLENIGKIDLVMIEAQVGEYLGEDDIVRIEDDFKRV